VSSSSEFRSGQVLELAEEFLERYRKGERPSLREYIDRHPELASEIRDVFPAMALMENIAVNDESMEAGSAAPASIVPEIAIRQLGDYRIIREIGHGGMGIVYEAEQVSLGRHVALKVLPNQAMADDKQKRRFEREARAAAKLHHTNIVPVFGVGEHEGLPYYVMQFIQGLGLDAVLDELNRLHPGGAKTPSLIPTAGELRIERKDVSAAVMARSLMTGAFQQKELEDEALEPEPAVTREFGAEAGPPMMRLPRLSSSAARSGSLADSFSLSSSSVTLPGTGSTATGTRTSNKKQTYWQSVANIGRQVADALEYAHKQGVLHRDVKPSNLLLDLKGTVWVTDFGLAKVAGPGGDNLTHTGDILGTLRYMPPEAFDGSSDARSDVYSLGLTLYELLAMRPAFDEKDRNKLIKQVTGGEPTPLGRLNREIPRDLVTVVEKCIAREPSRRYATAEELASDLQRFIDDEPILARRQTQVERYVRWARHNPGLATLGAALTAVLVIATIASLLIAGRMAQLASNEAKAADDERLARQSAVEAGNRETEERTKAVASQKRAEEALAKAEESYAKARAAVNEYLTAVGDDDRLKAPGLQGLRVQLLQSALSFYQQFLKERLDDPALRSELAGVYLKVGRIYLELGQQAAARQANALALQVYETLANERPDDADVQGGYARALHAQGQTDKSIGIWEKLVKPDSPKHLADLGSAYSDVASRATNDPPKRLEYLRKALETREKLASIQPNDAEVRSGLATSYNNIAVALGVNRREEALPLYRRAVEESEAAYRLRPYDPNTVRGLIVLTRNLARTSATLGHKDEAIALERRIVEICERRVRENPDLEQNKNDLLTAYYMLIVQLEGAGREDESDAVIKQAKARIREMKGNSEENLFGSLFVNMSAVERAEKRATAKPELKAEFDAAIDDLLEAFQSYTLFREFPPQLFDQLPGIDRLRDRPAFKRLVSVSASLTAARTVVERAGVGAGEKVNAYRQIVAGLLALQPADGGPPFARRSLAAAHEKLAEAYLADKRYDEAKASFADALAIRRKLAADAPKDEQAQADLAATQTSTGDLLAAAGRYGDAAKTWEAGIATLEDALKTNPNSVPYQSALAERSLQVAQQYGLTFLAYDRAAVHFRKAFERQPPTTFQLMRQYATILRETGDLAECRKLAERAALDRRTLSNDEDVDRAWTILAAPSDDPRWRTRVAELAKDYRFPPYVPHEKLIRALAHIHVGDPAEALSLAEGAPAADWKWTVVALAEYRRGYTEAAKAALREADKAFEQFPREVVASGNLRGNAYWRDHLTKYALRREAQRMILGGPQPDGPYDRLYRGRILLAFEKPKEAETEFAAAVAARPDDPEIWQARSRLFAKLGWTDRAVADLAHAQSLKSNDPRHWIETGRVLAELGNAGKADVAFQKAATLGKGELNQFLEAGWWAVGPYPEEIQRMCPPEFQADPSKPVAAIDRLGELKWTSVSTDAPSGRVVLDSVTANAGKGTVYAMTFVYAEKNRTASLKVRATSDLRVWVNGQIVLDGFAAWGIGGGADVHVPVALRAGRNRVLIKLPSAQSWNEIQFHDAPSPQAYALMHLGLWSEAADLWAEADRRGPLEPWRTQLRVQCLRAAGRDDEARKIFAEAVARHGRETTKVLLSHLSLACCLPPEKSPERDRWVEATRENATGVPNDEGARIWQAHAEYRAARFDECEATIRKDERFAARLDAQLLLALALHGRGNHDKARQVLQSFEVQYAERVKAALSSPNFRTPLAWGEDAMVRSLVGEAHRTILNLGLKLTADETSLRDRALRQRSTNLGIDEFERLVTSLGNQPRLWLARGRQLLELGKGEEAKIAFEKAVKLAPKSAQVHKEIGRAYADAGLWDAAAAAYAVVLDLVKPRIGWFGGNPEREEIARRDELYSHVAKLRPKDRQLAIERGSYLSRAARWAEATKDLARAAELDPKDHLTLHIMAPIQLLAGDRAGCTRSGVELLRLHGGSKNELIAQRVATARLMDATGANDLSTIVKLFANIPDARKYFGWNLVARALAHYRSGEYAQLIENLDKGSNPEDFSKSFGLAVRAMAQFKLNQPDLARQSLQEARALLASLPTPGPSEVQGRWIEWSYARAIINEAEVLIPAAPDRVAVAGPTIDDAARRARKDRSDRAALAAALALIRSDVGQKAEALAEFRAVWDVRRKLAEEEPENADYRAAAFAARRQFVIALAEAGQANESDREWKAMRETCERALAENPKSIPAQIELAAVWRSGAERDWKAGRHVAAFQILDSAMTLLDAGLKGEPGNAELGRALAETEREAGLHRYEFAQWREGAELLVRSVGRPGGGNDPWTWQRAGHGLAMIGDWPRLKKLVGDALVKFDKNSEGETHPIMLLTVFAPGLIEPPDRMLKIARSHADSRTAYGWVKEWAAVHEVRAGKHEDALRRLDTPELRGSRRAKAVMALAYHGQGKLDDARRLLNEAETSLAQFERDTYRVKSGPLTADVRGLAEDTILIREATQTITAQSRRVGSDELMYLARNMRHFGAPERADALLRAYVAARPDDPTAWLARSRAYAELGHWWLAAFDRLEAERAAERALAARPQDAAAATAWADLLDPPSDPKWTVLSPKSASSEGGSTLTVMPDGSILVGGKNPDKDAYIVELPVTGPIAALRLEALPDPTLPKSGPGRGPGGNFLLTELTATVNGEPVRWKASKTDYDQTTNGPGRNLAVPLGDQAGKLWSVFPHVGVEHEAILVPITSMAPKSNWIVKLTFHNTTYKSQALGRFRLSASSEAPRDEAIAFDDPHARLALALLKRGDSVRAIALLDRTTAVEPIPVQRWLAMSRARRRAGDAHAARDALSRAALALPATGADLATRLALRETVREIGPDAPGVAELLEAAAGEVPPALTQAIEENPGEANAHRQRALWYGRRGLWRKAAADFAEAVRLGGTTHDHMQYGAVLFQLGETERYREHARATFEKWAATTNNGQADQALKTSLLLPEPIGMPEHFRKLAATAVAGDPNQAWMDFFQMAKALHDLRAGKYDDALVACAASRRLSAKCQGDVHSLLAALHAIESLAHSRTKKPDDARRSLAEAKRLIEEHDPHARGDEGNQWWSDWLIARLLTREAESMIPMPGRPAN
jgi:serine/threonine protein kinase/tetratricopeptide (TPR) repeat protein